MAAMEGDIAELHARALAATSTIVRGIAADQLDRPTPCEGWDVRGLLDHVVGGNRWVVELVGGKTIEEVGDRLDGDQLGDDLVAAYESSAKAAADAFFAPGALQAPVAVSYGPVPGEVYAGHRFIDVLIHGWDLATATGQDATLDPELVAACDAVVAPQAQLLAGSGMFGTHVEPPADASPQTRLLARLGRRG
jgi:uncharacterized protein (TIGR03086 family)